MPHGPDNGESSGGRAAPPRTLRGWSIWGYVVLTAMWRESMATGPLWRASVGIDKGMGTSRRPYRTDLSDARWELLEPILSAWRAQRAGLGISKPKHDLREIVNAISYVSRTGISWHYLPHDFPPYQTVYGYYVSWQRDGLIEVIYQALWGRVRRPAEWVEQPESSSGIDTGQWQELSAVPDRAHSHR